MSSFVSPTTTYLANSPNVPSNSIIDRYKLWAKARTGVDPGLRPALDLNFAGNKSLVDEISGQNLVTFARGSTGTYVGADGLIKTATTNEARFDHDPVTRECLGLLVEEQRTNIDPNSLSQPASLSTVLNENISITTGATAPNGTSNFRTFTTTSSTNTLRSFYSTPISVTAGEVWTDSIYVDANNSSAGIMIFAIGNAGAHYLYGYMTINNNKTISVSFPTAGQAHLATFTPISSGYQNLGNNIYRVWYTYSVVNTGSITFGMGLYPNSNQPLGWSISVWGSQVEKGSFPTSYIPTSGSTATRSADIMEITGTNFSRWYNNSEGTAYVEAKNIKSFNSSQSPYIGFSAGTLVNNSNEWGVRYRDSGNNFETFVWSSGVSSTVIINSGSYPSSARIASCLNTTSSALSVNGNINEVTRTNATMPSVSSLRFHVVASPNQTPRQSTQFSRFTYWNRRLPNSNLQLLTQ